MYYITVLDTVAQFFADLQTLLCQRGVQLFTLVHESLSFSLFLHKYGLKYNQIFMLVLKPDKEKPSKLV